MCVSVVCEVVVGTPREVIWLMLLFGVLTHLVIQATMPTKRRLVEDLPGNADLARQLKITKLQTAAERSAAKRQKTLGEEAAFT